MSVCDSYLEDIEEIVIHPEYKPPKYINDVALIRLKNQIEFKNTIQPICLPSNDLPNLDKALFVGWGINGISNEIYIKLFFMLIKLILFRFQLL